MDYFSKTKESIEDCRYNQNFNVNFENTKSEEYSRTIHELVNSAISGADYKLELELGSYESYEDKPEMRKFWMNRILHEAENGNKKRFFNYKIFLSKAFEKDEMNENGERWFFLLEGLKFGIINSEFIEGLVTLHSVSDLDLQFLKENSSEFESISLE